MTNIPNGVVTFLFTDIEGSTKLAQEFHSKIQDSLKKHNYILHESVESNNGYVFKIIGDAFCCAFENTADAVNAAVVAQIKLIAEDWNEVVVKVRMGLHSGKAEWTGEDYEGYLTLATVQRVMSAANGGQILISNTSKNVDREIIRKGISFHDLGERRLKDLKEPMRLYQVISSGIQSDFPPLKTLDARPNNLPVQLTSFIGREVEMKRVKELLKHTHLLTLTGSGGSGKTRLALQVSADIIDDFANGVWLIELASLFEPALLPQVITNVFGVNEEPKRKLEDTLIDYLKDKEILIIFDNCERLVEPCAKLAEKLLSNCPKLKIIVTSREALRCDGEQTHRVLSLDTPDPKEEITPEKLSQYEAIRLFTDRALSVDENFRVNKDNAVALAQICYQLDGIPLAIELAAARIKILPVEKIQERLNNRFKLLTEGKRTALPRHQTLRAMIDWSYDFLSEDEKILWRRLSVFSGGWTMEASEEICSDDKLKKESILELLNLLTEKSIIIFEREKERYRIPETLKQYGEEKLKFANEDGEILSKHLHYFMELSETASPKLQGNEIMIWLDKLEAEHTNIQSAISWSLKNGENEKGARLAGALGNFWDIRGYYSTGRYLLENILQNVQEVSKSVIGKALNHAGTLSSNQGDYERAQKFFEESLALRRSLDDKHGIASSLNNLGNISFVQGNYEQAHKIYEESLALCRELGNKKSIAVPVDNLGTLANSLGNYEQAKIYFEESLSLQSEIGDIRGIANSLNGLGNRAFNLGNYEQAQKYYEESLILRREMGYKHGIAESLNNLGNVKWSLNNYEKAQKYFEESLSLSREIGDKRAIAYSLNGLGDLAADLKNYEQANKFYEEGLNLFRMIGDKQDIANALVNLGKMESDSGNYELAKKYYEESLLLSHELDDKKGIVQSLIGFAGIMNAGNQPSLAVLLLGAIETSLKSEGIVIEIKDLNQLNKTVTKLHEKLISEEFSENFEAGKKMTVEEAFQLMVNVKW